MNNTIELQTIVLIINDKNVTISPIIEKCVNVNNKRFFVLLLV